MASSSEIKLELGSEVTAEVENIDVRSLPFSFAKRNGVLIQTIEDGIAQTVHRVDATALSIAESRRFAGVPLKLTSVSAEDFDEILQQVYEQGSQMAMQMVGDLDDPQCQSRPVQRRWREGGWASGILRFGQHPVDGPLRPHFAT